MPTLKAQVATLKAELSASAGLVAELRAECDRLRASAASAPTLAPMVLGVFKPRAGGPTVMCSGLHRSNTARPGDLVIVTECRMAQASDAVIDRVDPASILKRAGVDSVRALGALSHADLQKLRD